MEQKYSLKGISKLTIILQFIFSKAVYKSGAKYQDRLVNCFIIVVFYLVSLSISIPLFIKHIIDISQPTDTILSLLISITFLSFVYFVFINLVIELVFLIIFFILNYLILTIISLRKNSFDFTLVLEGDFLDITIHQPSEININFKVTNISSIKKSKDFYFLEFNFINQKLNLPLVKSISEDIIHELIKKLKK